MLLLADLDDDARATADRVAHDLLATLETPFVIEGHEFEIAASIGVATFPDDGSEMSDVLKRADAALYEAKRAGRGTIRFAAAERAPATGQLTLTARMRRALARGEFELHYQPVWDVASGEAVAVEALLRWNDPERGMIPPGDFIPAAEDSGLIEPIGDWVVDAVIAQAAALARAGPAARHRVQRLTAPAALARASPSACWPASRASTRASSSPRSPSRRRWPTRRTPSRCSSA